MNLHVFGDSWVQLCEAVSVVKVIGGERDCFDFGWLAPARFQGKKRNLLSTQACALRASPHVFWGVFTKKVFQLRTGTQHNATKYGGRSLYPAVTLPRGHFTQRVTSPSGHFTQRSFYPAPSYIAQLVRAHGQCAHRLRENSGAFDTT